MTERLLQYIWQFQYFSGSELQTTQGENLTVLFPGKPNTNQGPDFLNAQIRINNTILAGSVELHLKTSQWLEHGHQHDPNYRNVVLHVVFEDDSKPASPHIPILELQPRISVLLLQRYQNLMASGSFISCAGNIADVKDIVWISWKERLLAERLTRKANLIFDFLQKNNGHWEEAFWWLLARNFGTKVNGEVFEAIAQSIPLNILAKHKSQIHQLESLLLGQAGLLKGEFRDKYAWLLQREYDFLKNKYNLKSVPAPVHLLRMRPDNFPTVRLAQLAMLVQQSAHLFSKILELEQLTAVKKLFDVTANDYWHYHYTIDEPSGFKKKKIGQEMTDNLIINSVVPVLFAYGNYHHEEQYKTKALRWLEEIAAEQNAITRGFAGLNLPHKSAYDSQAYIELKTQYCDHRHCLQCAVGNVLLKS